MVHFINLLVFQYFGENIPCHIRIICCLMGVLKHFRPLIMREIILQIKFKFQDISQSFVLLAFFENFAQNCFAEIISIE